MKNIKNKMFVPTKMLQDKENRKMLIAFVLWIFFGLMFYFSYQIGKPFVKTWWNTRPQELRNLLTLLPFMVIIYTIFISWCDHKWGYMRNR